MCTPRTLLGTRVIITNLGPSMVSRKFLGVRINLLHSVHISLRFRHFNHFKFSRIGVYKQKCMWEIHSFQDSLWKYPIKSSKSTKNMIHLHFKTNGPQLDPQQTPNGPPMDPQQTPSQRDDNQNCQMMVGRHFVFLNHYGCFLGFSPKKYSRQISLLNNNKVLLLFYFDPF